LAYVSDVLGLSDEAARYLLMRDGESAVAAKARRLPTGTAEADATVSAPSQGVAAAALGGAHELEVRFLAGCLAQPQKGRAVLAGVDESFFSTAETRAALRAVKQRLAAGSAGNISQTAAQAALEGEDGEAFAEIVVRAGQERFTETVVDELFLRVQEAHVSRIIARLKVTARTTGEAGKLDAERVRLQAVRRALREAISRIPVDEESGRG